jgi:hypothetical protein
MKHTRLGLFGLALVVAALFGCSQKVMTFKGNSLAGLENFSIHILADQAKEAPVKGSFGWGHSLFKVASLPDLNLSVIDERLHRAMSAGFTTKGMTFKDSESDLLVSYALASGAEIDDEELNKAYDAKLEIPVADPASALHYKRGVLVVDVVERKSKHLLWRGAIMAEINLNWPEERKQERCNAAVGELLRYYPHP